MKIKQILSSLLAAAMLLGSVTANAVTIESDDTPKRSGAAVEVESSGFNEVEETVDKSLYGLPENIEDGVILHAFCWSFKTIYDAIPEIAAAGYTAIQTSPVTKCYSEHPAAVLMGDLTNEKSGEDGAWWWQYQPTEFVVGNYQLVEDPTDQLACEAEYRAMCNRAHKYGIKIITDIVANHTTAEFKTEQGHTNEYAVTDDFKNAIVGQDGDFFDIYHDHYNDPRPGENYNRNQRINYMNGGLPDIDTENAAYQAYLVTFLNKLIELGCDGFRFDTALNIGIDGDGAIVGDGKDYNFWKAVTGEIEVNGVQLDKRGKDIFFYGEILKNDNSDLNRLSTYAKYMSATNSDYGTKLRDHVTGIATKNADSLSSWGHVLSSDKQVTWVESHDTYCNRIPGSTSHTSSALTDFQIRAGWAIITARAGGTPLFFNRPAGSEPSANDPEKIWGVNKLGDAANKIGVRGNDEFFNREVVAVNHFRNAMVGEGEKLRNINNDNNILQIDRGDCGSCIVNLNTGGVSIKDKPTCLADGFYVDYASETPTLTLIEVANGQFVTDYTVSSQSIAVLMSPIDMKAATDTPYFFTDTCDLTLTINERVGATSVTSGNYSVMVDNTEVNHDTFENNSTLTIGDDIDLSDSVTSKEITVILSAQDPNFKNELFTRTFTFAKRNESDRTYIYCTQGSQSWDPFCAYIYKGLSNDTTLDNGSWPGNELGTDPETGYRYVEVPYPLKDGAVLFTKPYSANSINKDPSSGSGYALEGKSKLYSGSSSFVDYVVTVPEDLVTFEDADQDLQTNSYVYFFNYNNWKADSIKITLSEGNNSISGLMKYSNDLHCYYYKYNSTVGYTKVTFTDNSNTSNTSGEIDLMPGEVYVPNGASSEWISPDDIEERKVFFKKRETTPNSTNKWNSVYAYCYRGTSGNEIANAAWPGIQTVNINDSYYAYTYYTPSNLDIYSKVVFNGGSDVKQQTADLDAPTNSTSKVYMPNNGATSTSNGNKVYPCSEESISDSTVNITLHYYDYKLAQINNSDTRTAYSVTNSSVAVTSGNIGDAITTCVENFSMKNQYDEYVFHTSQFDYVKTIAAAEDTNLIQGSNHSYASRINPMYYVYQTKDYRGFYTGIADLNTLYSSNEKAKWVTYKDSSGNEILPESVRPDFANVASIDLYAYSTPKSYTVTFYYPTQENSAISQIGKTNLYAANYNNTYLSSGAVKFNELVKSKEAKIITPEGYTFDGWYKIDGTNYLKVSSSMTYSFRATESTELFAVYKTNAEYDSKSGCTVTAKNTYGADVYANGSGNVMYRMNTVLNVYDCSDQVSDVAVVYVRLYDTTDSSTINTYLNTSTDGNNTIVGMRNTISDTLSGDGKEGSFSVDYNSTTCDASYRKYTNGTDAQLTNKNRLQFIQSVSKEKILGTYDENYENDYSNVLVFTAFKTGNEWKISDNCVYYSSGSPTTILLSGS